MCKYQIHVHLAVPRYYRTGDRNTPSSPVEEEPFQTSIHERIGSHLRLLRLQGLKELIKEKNFSHILIDADPASMMVYDVINKVRDCHTKVWAITNENRERNFLKVGVYGMLNGNIRT